MPAPPARIAKWVAQYEPRPRTILKVASRIRSWRDLQQLAALLAALHQGAPLAQARSKRLIGALHGRSAADPEVLEQTAESIAQVRAGPEAREGIAAFFARRKAPWAQ